MDLAKRPAVSPPARWSLVVNSKPNQLPTAKMC